MEKNEEKCRYRRIVVSVDKFKGTLTSKEAAQAIKCGLERSFPHSDILLYPMADGGDGSLEVVQGAAGGELVHTQGRDPLGRLCNTSYLMLGDTAFVEMAKISGLTLVPPGERDIMNSTTYGLGELIREAIEVRRARRVVVAIGGSATNDGGIGMLEALGFRYDKRENILDDSQVGAVTPHLWETDIEVACDVENPLLGENGAAAVYGPQKGATPELIPVLEQRAALWAEAVAKWKKVCMEEIVSVPGSGAAGGVGFALHSVLGGEIIPGWRVFSQMMNLEEAIKSADLVITGEGKFDRQSLEGKLPLGIAQICAQYRKPLWLICGRNTISEEIYRSYGICRLLPISYLYPRDTMSDAAEKLKKTAEAISASAIF